MGKKPKSNKRRLEKRRRREAKRKTRRQTARRDAGPRFRAANANPPWRDWDPSAEGIAGLARRLRCSPFAAALFAQDLEDDDEVVLPEGLWTPRRTAALASGDILAQLGDKGFQIDEATFVRAAASHRSAWDLAEALWPNRLRATSLDEAAVFAGLAACELWKRWLPDRPSKESLSELLAQGYGAALDVPDDGEEGDEAHLRALEIWLRFWDGVAGTSPADTKTLDDLQGLIEPTLFFLNWVQDFFTTAEIVANRWPERARRAPDVLRAVLDRGSAEDEDFVVPTTQDLAMLLDRVGRREEAEAVARDLIVRFPRRAAGYVVLADLAEGPWPPPPARAATACALLEDARGQVDDGDDYDLEARIAGLRALAAGSAEGADTGVPPSQS